MLLFYRKTKNRPMKLFKKNGRKKNLSKNPPKNTKRFENNSKTDNLSMIMHHLSRKSFLEVILLLQFRLDVVIDAPLGYTV